MRFPDGDGGAWGFEVRLLVAAGLALWLVAAIACVWELLALQPPDSPLRVGVLASPIAQLRGVSFGLGAGSLLAALLWPALYGRGQGRTVALTLTLGALLHAAALSYAAGRGLMAVQLLDPRSDARFVLYLRMFAHALTTGTLVALLVRSISPQRTS